VTVRLGLHDWEVVGRWELVLVVEGDELGVGRWLRVPNCELEGELLRVAVTLAVGVDD
jgi:hypothetical protein